MRGEMCLFRNERVTSEEEDDMINKVANKIHEYKMDLAAILFLQSFKPLTYVGGQLGRFMIYPFLFFLGKDISQIGEKFFTVFEKKDNIEKLIMLLEKKVKDEDLKEKEMSAEEVKDEEIVKEEGKLKKFLGA